MYLQLQLELGISRQLDLIELSKYGAETKKLDKVIY